MYKKTSNGDVNITSTLKENYTNTTDKKSNKTWLYVTLGISLIIIILLIIYYYYYIKTV